MRQITYKEFLMKLLLAIELVHEYEDVYLFPGQEKLKVVQEHQGKCHTVSYLGLYILVHHYTSWTDPKRFFHINTLEMYFSRLGDLKKMHLQEGVNHIESQLKSIK